MKEMLDSATFGISQTQTMTRPGDQCSASIWGDGEVGEGKGEGRNRDEVCFPFDEYMLFPPDAWDN